MEEYREVRQRTIQAVMETVKGPEAAVRAGLNAQIAYTDPDEDEFMDPYVVRPCW